MAAILFSTMTVCSAVFAGEAPQRVVWITIDALYAGHLHFMGYGRETSPWLDALATQSVVFDRAFSPSHTTVRSVPMYMTGRYQSELYENPIRDRVVPDRFVTLAEVFKAAGFATWWFTTNGNASADVGLGQGVDHHFLLQPASDLTSSIDELIALVRDEYTPGGGREFIYLHTADVHDPYLPPYPYDKMFADAYTRAVVQRGQPLDIHGERVRSNLRQLSEDHDLQQADIDFLVSQYDGAIRYTDARLAALLESVRFDPAHDLLLIAADHGEQFFEHGFWGHGYSLLTCDFHVPLIIRYDGFTPARHAPPVSLLDLFPTFCDLFGLERPANLRGTSILPTIRGEAQEPHYVVGEGADWHGRGAIIVGDGYLYALCTKATAHWPWSVWPFREELYDLQSDMACRNDVLGQTPEVALALNNKLREHDSRFAPFDRSRIRYEESKLAFGPNLFAAEGGGVSVPPPDDAFGKKGEDGTLALSPVRQEIVFGAKTGASFQSHVIDIEYTLASGALVFEVRAGETGEVLDAFTCRRPQGQPTALRRIVFPKSETTKLAVRIEDYGQATIGEPVLRVADTPVIWCAKWPADVKEEPKEDAPAAEAEPGMSDADKARLKALGYL